MRCSGMHFQVAPRAFITVVGQAAPSMLSVDRACNSVHNLAQTCHRCQALELMDSWQCMTAPFQSTAVKATSHSAYEASWIIRSHARRLTAGEATAAQERPLQSWCAIHQQ
eukprot:jgi/Ulvmu1/9746/UM055_0086.1